MNATLSPAIESNKGYVHRERPKYVLIIFLSGVAAATVLLLILLIALNFLGKRKKEKKYQLELKAAAKELEQLEDEDEDEGQNDDVEDDDEGEHKKTVTIEIQGGDNETKQISVNPGDIIIIDSKDVDNDDSEDLGYMSEIVRYYNSRNNGNDDGISIRKQSLTCETPSVLSIPNSEGDKREEYETLRMTSVGNGAIPDGPPIVNGSCVS
ncbi:uncharacterized protein LOC5505105 [Nematostella vectensis]|uniref:uncharacterized protein LOC5505105 n=1 Tax=Nematostella vectensis TaxID=45351 RepID=UPI00207727FC|nr:uncharacterized protein LOC5505105 [Nematostella vectensis]